MDRFSEVRVHTYSLLHKRRFKYNVSGKVHVNTAYKEEKKILKNSQKDTIGYFQKTKEITVVSTDQSLLFDSIVRRVCVNKGV